MLNEAWKNRIEIKMILLDFFYYALYRVFIKI